MDNKETSIIVFISDCVVASEKPLNLSSWVPEFGKRSTDFKLSAQILEGVARRVSSSPEDRTTALRRELLKLSQQGDQASIIAHTALDSSLSNHIKKAQINRKNTL